MAYAIMRYNYIIRYHTSPPRGGVERGMGKGLRAIVKARWNYAKGNRVESITEYEWHGNSRSSTSLKRISAILSHARSLNSLRKLSASSARISLVTQRIILSGSLRLRGNIPECFHGETARAFSCHMHVIVRRRNGRRRRRQEASKVSLLL